MNKIYIYIYVLQLIIKLVEIEIFKHGACMYKGGHTIGMAACQVFRYQLYNFNSTGGPDPTIDTACLPTLPRWW